MTREEVISYIKSKKYIEHEISGIYKHTKYSWIHSDGLNIFTCLFFENNIMPDKQNNFIIASGAGDHSRKCAIGLQKRKTYKLKQLTPELLDKIVDEILPQMYCEVEQDIKAYKIKQNIKKIEKDFQ